mmetsp:Transcript_34956/g.85072  ORF Transcript_34956/g.85072 Transcript_34956/m.85072 type:complete len:96 (+) Transcript_34956:103-390(+)
MTVSLKCTSFWVPGTRHGAQVESWVLNDCEHLTVSIECTSFRVPGTKHGARVESLVWNKCDVTHLLSQPASTVMQANETRGGERGSLVFRGFEGW